VQVFPASRLIKELNTKKGGNLMNKFFIMWSTKGDGEIHYETAGPVQLLNRFIQLSNDEDSLAVMVKADVIKEKLEKANVKEI
jgi:hypothetical protein